MENFLVGIVFVAVLLFIAFLLVAIFTEESREHATMLGRRPRRIGDVSGMNAKMYLSLGVFAFVFVFLGAYYITDESRRASAADYQVMRAEDRAVHTFAKNCASCHGNSGQGLIGPSLHIQDLAQRHNWDPNNTSDAKKLEMFIRDTIIYGWPPIYRGDKPVMPNWGDQAGGTLNEEQINELVLMIENGQQWEEVAKLAPAPAEPAAPSGQAGQSDPVALGQSLYTSKGCVACHGSKLEGGVGPKLAGLKDLPNIVGVLPMNQENLHKWLQNPPAVKPGTTMPNLNLKPEEIDALVQYLWTK